MHTWLIKYCATIECGGESEWLSQIDATRMKLAFWYMLEKKSTYEFYMTWPLRWLRICWTKTLWILLLYELW